MGAPIATLVRMPHPAPPAEPALDTKPLSTPVPRAQLRSFWKDFSSVPGARQPQQAVRRGMLVFGLGAGLIGMLAMAYGVGQEIERNEPDVVGQVARWCSFSSCSRSATS